MVPAPPHVAGQLPELFLRRGNEAVEGARFAHHRRHLPGRLHQHADFFVAEGARLLGLHHQHALQDAAVDQRHAQKRVVLLFARVLEVFVAGMIAGVGQRHREQSFGHQAGEALVQRHAQRADTSGMKAERGRQHQVRAVRLQQIRRTDIGAEARGDQRHHVHQRVGRFPRFLREAGDLLQGQNKIGVSEVVGWRHSGTFAFHFKWKTSTVVQRLGKSKA